MKFQQVNTISPLYRQSLQLREAVLRQPLGLTLTKQDTHDDVNQLHFVLTDHETVVATVTFNPISKTTYKLRQMAVSPSHQGLGLGRKIITAAEKSLITAGATEVTMAARDTAIEFYQNLGYETVGGKFQEVGITHIVMTKHL